MKYEVNYIFRHLGRGGNFNSYREELEDFYLQYCHRTEWKSFGGFLRFLINQAYEELKDTEDNYTIFAGVVNTILSYYDELYEMIDEIEGDEFWIFD